jgi:competence protein ComEC
MRHAGLRAFLAVAAGIVLQQACHLSPAFLLVFLALSLAAAFFTRGWSLLLSLLAAASLSLQVQTAPVTDIPFRFKGRFEASVLSEPIPKLGSRAYAVALTRVRIGERSYPLGLKARLGSGRLLRYGEMISFPGSLQPFSYPRNPGIVDLNEFYERQGFAGRMSARSGIVLHDGNLGNPLMRLVVMPVRRHFIDVIGQHFAGTNRSLLAGLLLGEKGTLPEETREAFQSAGIMHVLAVSGLHVGILVGICLLLLGVLGIRNLAGLAILAFVTFLYVGITGFTASAVRAGIMSVTLSLGLFIQRRYDPVNGLFIAGIGILLLSPPSLFEVGFQLSFAAALAILLFYPHIKALFGTLSHRRHIDRWVLSPAAVTASGQLGTAPLVAYYFYRLPLVSFLANLLVVPLVGIALPWGMLLMITDTFSHRLTAFLGPPLDVILSAITWLTQRIGGFSWSAPVVGRPSLLLIVWFYALILLVFLALTRKWARRPLLYAALAGVAAWVWIGALEPTRTRVTFLDTVRGDATFFEFPNGRRLLVDAGSADDYWLESFLRSRGVSRLDLLAITHPHPHVCAGIENLLTQVPVRDCLVPIDSSGDPGFDSLIARLRQSGTRILVAGRGDRLSGVGVDARFAHPAPLLRRYFLDRLLDANDLSLVLRLAFPRDTFLLAGDLDNAGLLRDEPVQANWLLAPHQGSIRANSDRLFDQVRPREIVVSGRYRPRPGFLDRCAARGIRVRNLRAGGSLTLAF